jgi:hypothetical protein
MQLTSASAGWHDKVQELALASAYQFTLTLSFLCLVNEGVELFLCSCHRLLSCCYAFAGMAAGPVC